MSSTFDAVGPITKSVADAAIVLSVISGVKHYDQRSSLKGARLGVPRQLISSDLPRYQLDAFNEALEVMRGLGATILDDLRLPDASVLDHLDYGSVGKNASVNLIWEVEFAEQMDSMLTDLEHSPVRSFDKLVKCMATDPREKADKFPTTWIKDVQQVATKLNTSSDEYWLVRARSYDIGNSATNVLMDRYNLSAIVLPGSDPLVEDFAQVVTTLARLPTISVPLGAAPPDTPSIWDEHGVSVVRN